MDLKDWKITFSPGWDKHFSKLDTNTQKLILKKLEQMAQPLNARKLHNSKYYIEEVGQYRIVFTENEINLEKQIFFIGDHKQYEKWYKSLF